MPDAFPVSISFPLAFSLPIQSRHGYHDHSVSLALQHGMFSLFALLQVTLERHAIAFSLFVQCSITLALSVCHCTLLPISVDTVARLPFSMKCSHGHTPHGDPLPLSVSVSVGALHAFPLHPLHPFPVGTICKCNPIAVLTFSLSFAFPDELIALGEADRREVSFSLPLAYELVFALSFALARKLVWMGCVGGDARADSDAQRHVLSRSRCRRHARTADAT